MGIYIPDMEMPKDCLSCPCMVSDCEGDMCAFQSYEKNATFEDWEQMKASCPLVPAPPHGRLGDLDRLEQMFVDIDNAPYSGFDGTEPFYSAEDAAQIIRLAPTIIPAEEDER